MSSLTKAEISKTLFENLGLTRRDANDLTNAFFETIKDELAGGKQVKISGFGNFELRDKPARPGRNPRNGKPHVITARRVTTFHPGGKLKSRTYTKQDKPH